MNELKDKLIALSNSIIEERKDVLKIQKSMTDDILRECIEILSRSYTHEHHVNDESVSAKELDLVLMAHARYACLRKGQGLSAEEGIKYMSGYMDGQRKMFIVTMKLFNALRQFQSAHPCTDADGNTCPTHRSTKKAIEEFEEWMSPELAQPIS